MPITKEAIPAGWLKYCEQAMSVCEMLGVTPEFVVYSEGGNSWLKFLNTGDTETSSHVLDTLREDLIMSTRLTCMVCGNFSRKRYCGGNEGCEA